MTSLKINSLVTIRKLTARLQKHIIHVRGGAAGPAGQAKAGPLFSRSFRPHFQTPETVCQRDGWARCLTQVRLCPACRRFSYKSFPLFCQQIMQAPGATRPDCIGTHVLLNTLRMRIRRAAASDMAHSAACSSSASQSSPTRRPNAQTPHQLLSLPVSEKTTDAVLYHLHISCCRPPCTCTSHLLCAVACPLLKCRRHLCTWVISSIVQPLFNCMTIVMQRALARTIGMTVVIA